MLKTLEEHNREAIMRLQRTLTGSGIACPKCGSELRDSNLAVALTSNPPRFYVDCPDCEWTGTRY